MSLDRNATESSLGPVEAASPLPTQPHAATGPSRSVAPMSSSSPPPPARVPRSATQLFTRGTAAAGTTSGSTPRWCLADFDIGPKLGEGRFGKIYLCRERSSHCAVVLKLISKDAVFQHDLVHQIQREVELHMYCRHPHIVRMLAYFWDEQRIFLVLDYADGGNLLSLLESLPGRRMPEARVAPIAAQLCSAVYYLHRRGVVHRDIKPENILFKKGCLKLADFTWAVLVPPADDGTSASGHERRTPNREPRGRSPSSSAVRRRRATICGTVDYLPPEMVTHRTYDEAVDMWSVGATVFEMLVGFPPFETPTIRETEERIAAGRFVFPYLLRDQLSWDAQDFVTRLLQVDPTRRLKAREAVLHPFVAPFVAAEKLQRSRSRSRSTRSNHKSSVAQQSWDAGGRLGSTDADNRLHFSSVSVSACTTFLGTVPSAVPSAAIGASITVAAGASSLPPHNTTLGNVSSVVPSATNPNVTTTVTPSATSPSDITASTQEGTEGPNAALGGDAAAVESDRTSPRNEANSRPSDDLVRKRMGTDPLVERMLEFDGPVGGGSGTDCDAAGAVRRLPARASTPDSRDETPREPGQAADMGDDASVPSMNITAIAADGGGADGAPDITDVDGSFDF